MKNKHILYMVKVVSLKNITRLGFIAILFYSLTLNIFAQKSPLTMEISLQLSDVVMKDALTQIADQVKFNFSYNSEIIDNYKPVTITAKDEKVKSILDDLLDENIQYRIVGNHIVLLEKQKSKSKSKEIKNSGYSISGIIYDSSTGRVIRSATIYDINGELTSITNTEGYYSIFVPANNEFRGLTYCKQGYLDTVIIVKPVEDIKIDMYLQPITVSYALQTVKETIPSPFSFDSLRIVGLMIPSEAMSHSNNLVLYDRKIGQVSFLPFPGVHTSVNGASINRMSMNILAGYTGGVDGVEVGGFLNIDKNYVNGVQVAGFGNIVGKKTTGVQVAGFINVNTGSITGVQVAGFNNVTNDTITGVQVAGFTNYLRGVMNGVQVAGFYNHITNSGDWAQVAGFLNYAGRDFKGAQLAGFANVAKDSILGAQVAGFANHQKGPMRGAQLAGFSNISRGELIGGQVAGFSNFAVQSDSGIQVAGFVNFVEEDFSGIQVAGFLNRAKSFSGLQIGTINISESSDGYSIGVFNHVKNGYRAIELSTDEVLYGNLTYKTGTRKLHNILNIGVQPFSNTWSVGFGFGSSAQLGKKFQLFEGITANAINEDVIWENRLNLLNKVFLGIDYQIATGFALFVAGSFNVHVSGRDRLTNEFNSDIAFFPFFVQSGSNVQTQMWFGGKLGLKMILK